MKVMTHPRFRDVAWQILNAKQYKPGFIDITFFWVYPPKKWRPESIKIFHQPSKTRIPLSKWKEFINYSIED